MKEICFKVFQEKYIIELVLSLYEKPKGFNLLQKEHSINTATLNKRLLLMERAEFIQKKRCEHDARAFFYLLTERGEEMAIILLELEDSFHSSQERV